MAARDRDKVLVANGQGFWGDSLLGPVRLVNEGPLDYLTLDYLAEVTMSIMQKLKSRDPNAGYATDFVRMVERVLPVCREKDIKIICNAGGVNPHACRRAVADVIKKLGISGVRIGIVEGDDILADLPQLVAGGEALKNMDTGEPLGAYVDRVQSANVYIGAAPSSKRCSRAPTSCSAVAPPIPRWCWLRWSTSLAGRWMITT